MNTTGRQLSASAPHSKPANIPPITAPAKTEAKYFLSLIAAHSSTGPRGLSCSTSAHPLINAQSTPKTAYFSH